MQVTPLLNPSQINPIRHIINKHSIGQALMR
jgi:hypothetical protein